MAKKAVCIDCGAHYDVRRQLLGYPVCMDCGEDAARQVVRCVVPLPKGNYTLITRKEELRNLNQKTSCYRPR